MQVFGPPWDAPVYEDSEKVLTPVDRPCLDCHIPIKDGDQGYMVPYSPAQGPPSMEPRHRLCLHRRIVPHFIMNIPGYNT